MLLLSVNMEELVGMLTLRGEEIRQEVEAHSVASPRSTGSSAVRNTPIMEALASGAMAISAEPPALKALGTAFARLNR